MLPDPNLGASLGTPYPTSNVSCLACRCAKKFCDRSIPCGRCRRLQIECVPQTRGRPRSGASVTARAPTQTPKELSLFLPPVGQGDCAYPVFVHACRGLLRFTGQQWTAGTRRPAAHVLPGAVMAEEASHAMMSTLNWLWRSGKLDRRKTEYVRTGIEYLQIICQQSFNGTELTALLQDLSRRAGPTGPPTISRRDAFITHQPQKGKEWVQEIYNTMDAWTIFYDMGISHLEVSCGLLMSQRVGTTEEYMGRTGELRYMPLLVLSNYLSQESLDAFYEALTHCVFAYGNHAERNVLVEVLDREGFYTPCLATIRSHWHLNKASIAVRMWPLQALLFTSLPPPSPRREEAPFGHNHQPPPPQQQPSQLPSSQSWASTGGGSTTTTTSTSNNHNNNNNPQHFYGSTTSL